MILTDGTKEEKSLVGFRDESVDASERERMGMILYGRCLRKCCFGFISMLGINGIRLEAVVRIR